MSRRNGAIVDPRLAEVLDVIFRFASGDLGARGEVSDRNTPLDAVMAGVNILGEELEASLSERERAETELRSASLYARSLIEASLDSLMTIGSDGRIMDLNAAAERATGVPRDELVGSDFAACFTMPGQAIAAYRSAYVHGHVANWPLTMVHRSGATTEVLFNASLYHDELGRVAGVLAVARDISDRLRAERAEELASRDGLTGLYNHGAFYTLLAEEILRTARFDHPMSLLMLDIDHFKQVNDIHGHQAGDEVLRGLGILLERRARVVDRICRYGGEEFAVILPETDSGVAVTVAERIREDVEQATFDVRDGPTISVTVSIGVASIPEHVDSADALVRAADLALYAAKHEGRNRTTMFGTDPAGRTSCPVPVP